MERMSSIWTIRRSATDVKLTGLCGGVARYWGIDPLLVRVGWALLALSGGIGLVLYLAGWLLIPVEGNEKALADDLLGESVRRWPKELWITLVVVTSLAMFTIFGWLSPFGIGPAIVIAVIWYFGFYKGRHGRAGDVPTPPADTSVASAEPSQPQFVRYPGPPTPFTEAAEAWQRRVEEHVRQEVVEGQTAATPPDNWPSPPPANVSQPTLDPEPAEHTAFLAEPDPVGLYAEPAPAVPVNVPVRMSDTRSAKRLRMVSLIALGLTLSGLGIAQAFGVAIPLATYLAAALLVIGITLVVATWLGLARGLLPVGALLAVAVLVATAAGPALQLPGMATSHVYTTVAELPAAGDREDFGRLAVDLSQLAVTADTDYTAHVDLGRLDVAVPDDAYVVVNYTADMGAVHAYGEQIKEGSEITGRINPPQPAQPGQPVLTLNLSVDAGNIQVRR
jgi:phage shock protein PspC (stress-responsive transcriptional regulator)